VKYDFPGRIPDGDSHMLPAAHHDPLDHSLAAIVKGFTHKITSSEK
jgi:hypothetical protein